MPEQPYHHGDLRRHLVAAARVRVERSGVEGVSVARLATECGVSGAAPYRHFPSRDALLGAVADVGFKELTTLVRKATESSNDPRDRFVEVGAAYVNYAVEHPEVFRLMFSSHLASESGDRSPEARTAVADAVAALDLSVAPDVASRVAWGLVRGLAQIRATGQCDSGAVLHEDSVRDDLRALLDGIAAPASGR